MWIYLDLYEKPKVYYNLKDDTIQVSSPQLWLTVHVEYKNCEKGAFLLYIFILCLRYILPIQ